MATIYGYMVAKGKEPLLDGSDQGIVIASRKIRSANGTSEQGIADKNDIWCVEGNASRCVSGGMDDLQSDIPDLNGVAVLQGSVSLGRIFRVEPELGRHLFQMGQHRFICRMDHQGGSGGLLDFFVGADMIEMTMGVDDAFDGQIQGGKLQKNFSRFRAGVDDSGFSGSLTSEDEAIGHDRPDDKRFNDHDVLLP